jgi:ion channel-forming bestrophin family protein
MINYNPKHWFSLIFGIYSKRIFKILFTNTLIIGTYTFILTYVIEDIYHLNFRSTTAVHSLLGIVLGLFLVFRTNSAYDRWWEGRKLWGSLVNSSRNLALKVSTMANREEEKLFFSSMIGNFAFSLKEHLRDRIKIEDMENMSAEDKKEMLVYGNGPTFILTKMYEKLDEMLETGSINGQQLIVIDNELKQFTDILGACERIKNTPIPYNYSMFMKKFIFIFTITLPFGFMSNFDYWTVPIVVLIFNLLVSIELIAEEIEDPFGTDKNDLPTDELAIKIKTSTQGIIKLAKKKYLSV